MNSDGSSFLPLHVFARAASCLECKYCATDTSPSATRARSLTAIGLTALLYLFWTIPATAVQTLASVNTLSQFEVLKWLKEELEKLGPAVVGRIETQLPALALAALRAFTLSSPIFIVLVKLQGATSHTTLTVGMRPRVLHTPHPPHPHIAIRGLCFLSPLHPSTPRPSTHRPSRPAA